MALPKRVWGQMSGPEFSQTLLSDIEAVIAESDQRIARLERLFVLATMGGKDAAAETNKILQQLIKDAGA